MFYCIQSHLRNENVLMPARVYLLLVNSSLCPQFLNREIAQIGTVFLIPLIDKAHMADKRLDGRNL